jgi:hypothetical protein
MNLEKAVELVNVLSAEAMLDKAVHPTGEFDQ